MDIITSNDVFQKFRRQKDFVPFLPSKKRREESEKRKHYLSLKEKIERRIESQQGYIETRIGKIREDLLGKILEDLERNKEGGIIGSVPTGLLSQKDVFGVDYFVIVKYKNTIPQIVRIQVTGHNWIQRHRESDDDGYPILIIDLPVKQRLVGSQKQMREEYTQNKEKVKKMLNDFLKELQ